MRTITEGLTERKIECDYCACKKPGLLYLTPKTGCRNEEIVQAIRDIMPDVPPFFYRHEQIAGPTESLTLHTPALRSADEEDQQRPWEEYDIGGGD